MIQVFNPPVIPENKKYNYYAGKLFLMVYETGYGFQNHYDFPRTIQYFL